MTELIAAASPRLTARIAGAFYLLTIVLGVFALFFAGPLTAIGEAANYIAAASYVVVAVLLYHLFRPVSRGVSLIAASISVTGCASGSLSSLHLIPDINSFIFFGIYCVLIGYLILRSTFLPRILGVLMALAGFGYLASLWPPLETHLSSFIALVGLLGEGLLTAWLLLAGVDDRRWREQAGVARPTTAAAQTRAT